MTHHSHLAAHRRGARAAHPGRFALPVALMSAVLLLGGCVSITRPARVPDATASASPALSPSPQPSVETTTGPSAQPTPTATATPPITPQPSDQPTQRPTTQPSPTPGVSATPAGPSPTPDVTPGPTLRPTPTPAPATGPRSTVVLDADGSADGLSGIGRLEGLQPCTAWLLSTVDPDARPNAPAYVVTSGRCVQPLTSNEVLLDSALRDSGPLRVTFRWFRDTQDQQLTVRVNRIAWASQKGTDLAILRLRVTLRSLVDQGIVPLTVARAVLDPGSAVAVVGAPVLGADAAGSFLRRATCTAGDTVDLIEGPWHSWGSVRTDCSDMVAGASGSPLLDRRSGEVVGVMDTSTLRTAAKPPCSAGVPCERGPDGVARRPNTSYAQPVLDLGACFDGRGSFLVERDTCPLDPAVAVVFRDRAADPSRSDGDLGTRPPVDGATWDLRVRADGDYAFYRFKTGRAEETDCTDAAGYGDIRDLAATPTISEPLPTQDGVWLLCLIGGPSAADASNWQPTAFATVGHVVIDSAAPAP